MSKEIISTDKAPAAIGPYAVSYTHLGVESGMIVAEGDETSYSVVISVAGIDRIILHDSGANNTFTMEDIDFDLVRDASLFHFGYPSIMRSMYQDGGAPMVELFRKVKSLGVATSLDMAIVDVYKRQVHYRKQG